ncbi:MAG: type II CAAX endopeptidase family protein [bacterium]
MSTTALATPIVTPPARATSIRRALLFLLVCSPSYLIPGLLPIPHPAILAGIVIAISWLFLRREGRSLAVLGLDPSPRRFAELAAGFVGGATLILAIALLVWLLLPFPWRWNPTFKLGVTGFSLLWLLSGNAVEELVFRGYSFERLIHGIGHWPAQIVTALWFALFHVVNGWPWQVALTGTTVGSLLFGLVFVRWRSVPAAIGVHAAVNWTRDLLLTDPPTGKTLLAPLSPRPWTSGEQMTAVLIMDGIFLLAALALWRSSRTAPESLLTPPD